MTAFRDELASCPRCGEPLDPGADRVNCTACKGVLIDEHHVLPVVRDALNQPIEALPLEDRTAKDPALICPACKTPMTTHLLYGIEIDRCAKHGLWFDGDELRRVMEAVQKEGNADQSTVPRKVIAGAYIAGMVALNIIRFLYF